MAAEKIGLARCPLCKSPSASVSLSKKLLVCLTCNACNLQVFARSGRSDELIRAHITTHVASESVAAPSPLTLSVAPVVAAAAPVAAAKPRVGLFAWP